MLRLLSWNACDFSPPDMRMFLPKHDSPSIMPQTPSAIKRKRSLDERSVLAEPSDSKMRNNISDPSVTSRTGIISQPDRSELASTVLAADGLPTPLLSPTDVKMDEHRESDEGVKFSNNQTSEARLQSMRNTIQTQLSLEILLKHNELRLIDQELAKCQIALEQLRRCSEIPFPVNQLSENVSHGAGPALRSSFSGRLPESPAPWGVADGPYSRHLAKWLLPSSRFDGGEPDPAPIASLANTPTGLRSARGSFIESGQVGMKSRSQRSGHLKALPAGYGQPKEKASGPMILKRKSDGTSVKLVCPDCGRFDFGSAQGFINHCRIGHGRNFASHDAAAEACGEPVEYDQTGAMIGVQPVITPSTNCVHPLIRQIKLMPPPPPRVFQNTGNSSTPSTKAKTTVSPDFRASTSTPHLSALVQEKGLGMDLQEMVMDAKKKVSVSESDAEESEDEPEIPVTETSRGRHPQVAGTKQLTKPSKSPATSPVLTTRAVVSAYNGSSTLRFQAKSEFSDKNRGGSDADDQNQLGHLDPSPTTESTQAPSLIDDDEEMEAQSPASISISEDHDDGEVDFEVQDEDDSRQSIMPRPPFQPSCTQTTTRPPSARVRRPSALRRQMEDREEKHVSFVSPIPDQDVQDSVPGGDRKRRKTSKS